MKEVGGALTLRSSMNSLCFALIVMILCAQSRGAGGPPALEEQAGRLHHGSETAASPLRRNCLRSAGCVERSSNGRRSDIEAGAKVQPTGNQPATKRQRNGNER